MNNFICDVCEYVLETDLEFDDIPEDYVCPVCGVTKEYFSEVVQ